MTNYHWCLTEQARRNHFYHKTPHASWKIGLQLLQIVSFGITWQWSRKEPLEIVYILKEKAKARGNMMIMSERLILSSQKSLRNKDFDNLWYHHRSVGGQAILLLTATSSQNTSFCTHHWEDTKIPPEHKEKLLSLASLRCQHANGQRSFSTFTYGDSEQEGIFHRTEKRQHCFSNVWHALVHSPAEFSPWGCR